MPFTIQSIAENVIEQKMNLKTWGIAWGIEKRTGYK